MKNATQIMAELHQERVEAAFNAASGIITGLEGLKGRAGSHFRYKVVKQPQQDRIVIMTNVQAPSIAKVSQKFVHVVVDAKGQATAFGDSPLGPQAIQSERRGTQEIVNFVAGKAALKGLLV